MKNECSIIRDLLPLYAEQMVSEETAEFIREHLEHCPDCQQLLDAECVPVPEQSISEVPMHQIQKTLKKRRLHTIFFTAIVVAAFLISGFAILDAPEFFPYDPELLSLTENQDGTVTIQLSENITDYAITRGQTSDNPELNEYTLETWTSQWDRLTAKRGIQTLTFPMEGEQLGKIYYTSNNGTEDVLLYGTQPQNGGRMTLPRLVLGTYLTIAAGVLVLLVFLRLAFRESKKIVSVIERIALYPVSYGISHLIVMGHQTISYSIQRDLGLMMMLSVCLYLAFLHLYHRVKLQKEMNWSK